MEARRQIVVIGAGVVGATTALALARSLPSAHFDVRVVRTEADADDLGGASIIASQQDIRRFHADHGVDETDMVRRGIASYSLGTAYAGWMGDQTRPTFAPFGDTGVPIGGVPFHQLAARMTAAGQPCRTSDYSIAALMAQAGRFAPPSMDPRSPLSSFTYGLHLHRQTYADHLLGLATREGAVVHLQPLTRCIVENGEVIGLRLADDRPITCDLAIDTIGIALDALAPEWVDLPWSARMLTWDREDRAPPAPYALVAAHAAGWQCTTPGALGVGEQLVVLDDAVESNLSALQVPPDAIASRPRLGRRESMWRANVLGIGRALAALAPVAALSLHLAQTQLARLLRLFPAREDKVVETAEYQRETAAEIDRAIDFLQLRLVLNGRVGEPCWDRLRDQHVSPELADKIRLYRSRGRIPLLDGDEILEADWAALFEAQGVVPERYDALADAITPEALQQRLSQVRELMLRAIAPLPTHGHYLATVRGKVAA